MCGIVVCSSRSQSSTPGTAKIESAWFSISGNTKASVPWMSRASAAG